VGRLLARPRRYLLIVLLVATLSNVVFFVTSSVLERRIGGHVLAAGVNIALLLVLILFADLLPKLTARTGRVRFCRLFGPALARLSAVWEPVVGVLEVGVVEPLLRLIRPSVGRARTLTPEELAALLELSASAGEIHREDQRLLGDIVELGQARVRDVMTPRIAMPWVDDSASPQRVRDRLLEAGAGAVAVFRRSLDGEPLGLLDAKGYLVATEVGSEGGKAAAPAVADFVAPAVFVPERSKLDQLLYLLGSRGEAHALCVDEFGAVVGMVSVSDVVERMIAIGGETAGELADRIVRLEADRWQVPGRLSVREMLDYFAGRARTRREVDEDVSTVAGLFFARLGRVPRPGDSIRVGNVVLTVETMAGRVVDRVLLWVRPEEEAGTAA
jgi:putative hemolysin